MPQAPAPVHIGNTPDGALYTDPRRSRLSQQGPKLNLFSNKIDFQVVHKHLKCPKGVDDDRLYIVPRPS